VSASAIISLILGLLKFVNFLTNMAQENKWMKAGADAEIAKVSAAILTKTQAGKALMEKVNAMSDADVDAELRGLEPK
jgi:hypothetical protein